MNNLKCCYCEKELTDISKTRDHLIAKSKGGKITLPCCFKCNHFKENYSLEIFALVLDYLDPIGNKIKVENARRIRKELGDKILYIPNYTKPNKVKQLSTIERLIINNQQFADGCPF